MFYLLAFTSMVGYALQNVLLVKYARRVDGLSLAFYRNASFFITFLPLLLFSSAEEIMIVLTHWKALLLSGLTGGLYLAIVFTAYRHIAVGMADTTRRASITIFMTILGFLLFDEVLSPLALLLIGVIVASCIWLAVQRVHSPHISQKVLLGIALSVVSAIPVAVTKITLTEMSRIADPLTSAYFWEASIGIASLGIIALRMAVLKKGLQRVDRKTLFGIAAAASPTVVGTACYALALSMGPIALVSAIGSGSLFVTAVLAGWWYHEKLQRIQWVAMALIMGAIIWLRFV